MWIRIDNVICQTDEFYRFYKQDMPGGYYGILGEQSNSLSTLLGEYRDMRKQDEAFNNLYAALERGDKAFIMPKSDKR